MLIVHPIQLSEIAKIIYAERLQEAEQSRRLATLFPANNRPWFLA